MTLSSRKHRRRRELQRQGAETAKSAASRMLCIATRNDVFALTSRRFHVLAVGSESDAPRITG